MQVVRGVENVGVITDEERCRLIAEFEGHDFGGVPFCAVCGIRGGIPHYAHDLNATMRAARRLPEPTIFALHLGLGKQRKTRAEVFSKFGAKVISESEIDDPARAAFLCLSDWIAAQGRPK